MDNKRSSNPLPAKRDDTSGAKARTSSGADGWRKAANWQGRLDQAWREASLKQNFATQANVVLDEDKEYLQAVMDRIATGNLVSKINSQNVYEANLVKLNRDNARLIEDIDSAEEDALNKIADQKEDIADAFFDFQETKDLEHIQATDQRDTDIADLNEAFKRGDAELTRQLTQTKEKLQHRYDQLADKVDFDLGQTVDTIQQELKSTENNLREGTADSLAGARQQNYGQEKQFQSQLRQAGLGDSSLAQGKGLTKSKGIQNIIRNLSSGLRQAEEGAEFATGQATDRATETKRSAEEDRIVQSRFASEDTTAQRGQLEYDNTLAKRDVNKAFQRGADRRNLQVSQAQDDFTKNRGRLTEQEGELATDYERRRQRAGEDLEHEADRQAKDVEDLHRETDYNTYQQQYNEIDKTISSQKQSLRNAGFSEAAIDKKLSQLYKDRDAAQTRLTTSSNFITER